MHCLPHFLSHHCARILALETPAPLSDDDSWAATPASSVWGFPLSGLLLHFCDKERWQQTEIFFIFTSFSFVVCRTKCLPKKLQICTCVAVTNVYCQMNFAVGQGLDPCHRLLSYSQMKQLYMVEPNFWQTKMCLI